MMASKVSMGSVAARCIAAVFSLSGLFAASSAAAQSHAMDPSPTALVDEDQLTYEIDTYREVAPSGAARGETIFYYKCWACHNSFTEDAGPPMKDVYKRPVLMTGEPLNEQTMAKKIREGGPRMPGFRRLTDADLADLNAYLRSESCCFEGETPPRNPRYRAEVEKWTAPTTLKGGPRGVVRSATSGQLLEGIRVQLIAPNSVRTTVFTNDQGLYEFPVMQTGAYTLRIATSIPYKPYRRKDVRIEGQKSLPDIVLEPIEGNKTPPGALAGALTPIPEFELPGALPATQEVISQLSGAEMLWNLPGTVQEKALFARSCGVGCHAYQQIFRNRFDEHGWRVMIDRMLGYGPNSLLKRRNGYYFASKNEVEQIIRWLAKVRGPDSVDMPLRKFPRPNGASTRVVITEYEMPRKLLGIHDTYADANGNIWYSSHRTPWQGVLDPRTGVIKEYKMPPTPGTLPGAHAVEVDDKHGYAWFSENWAFRYSRLNIATGEIKSFTTPELSVHNFALAPDGSVWTTRGRDKKVVRLDRDTGEIVDTYDLRNPIPYQNAITFDGRFWSGGSAPNTGTNTGMILDIRSGKMYETTSGDRLHSAARGGFEPKGHDAWYGGRDGVLAEIVNEIDKGKGVHIRTYQPPTPYYPYTMFYTAKPDIQGRIWAGVLHGPGFLRYDTLKDQWRVYENAEPSALSRNTFVDNSTNPATVWYPDFHTNMIVRIQPLD